MGIVTPQSENGAPNGVLVTGYDRGYWFPREETALEVSRNTKQPMWRAAAEDALRYYRMTGGLR